VNQSLLSGPPGDARNTGELAALIALELTVMERYGDRIPKKKRSFAALLKHMVDVDGLEDAQRAERGLRHDVLHELP